MPDDIDTTSQWWKRAVIYQIYPRSFADSNGDGIGDLEGIRQRLDHLTWLGVDALWVSPIFPSPMADFGYDVADYCDVDPIFGDLAAFDRLLGDVHDRGMRLILDWVPNHTSDQHPWFLDARSGRDSAHRDFYIWRDPAPDGGVPNNWTPSLTDGPAWTFDEASGQYYLHLFLSGQPDLNWANPAVEEAMHDTLRFWLDRGVDGFRADVVHCIGKLPALVDDPPELVGLPHCILHDEAPTHELFRRIRTLLDGYPQHPMMVGEIVLLDPELIVGYLGDQLHLAFNFQPMYLPWDAELWHRAIETTERAHGLHDDWPTWFLSNHDVPRQRTRYASPPNAPVDAAGSEQRARAAAVLLLTLRGTLFLYQGEELGLRDADVPADRVVDPGGRDGCRAPIPWDRSPGHGWADPWLPLPPEIDERNVAAQYDDPASMLYLYRRLISVRRSSNALRDGALELVGQPAGVVGFRRISPDGSGDIVVLVNMADHTVEANLTGSWSIVVDSLDVDNQASFDGTLVARQAVVLNDRSALRG